jgi:alpha-tubulin suppressor-like RCC1 family protein
MKRITFFSFVLILGISLMISTQMSGYAARQVQSERSPSGVPSNGTPLPDIVELATGNEHTCALTKGSGVKCWGSNDAGQLGNGNIISSSVPVDVFSLSSDVDAISVGGKHTCALTKSGGVKCWGANSYGQLGNNESGNKIVPVAVIGLSSGVSAISAGGLHTCALMMIGSVKCWGYNAYGQLGNGVTNPNSNIPVEVVGLNGVSAIRAGYAQNCALLDTGGVKCWGRNLYGQLGNGSSGNRNTPVDVFGLSSGVSAITSGYGHTCALLETGGVKCWGYNGYGQLGNNGVSASDKPVDVISLVSGVSAITANGILIGGHTCALLTTGGVKCWGLNRSGQLGNGNTTKSGVPVEVTDLSSGINAISAGGEHTCAITTNANVKCWGSNLFGQLGNHNTISSTVPIGVVTDNPGIATPTATPTLVTPVPTPQSTPTATTTPTSTSTLPWVILIYLNGDNDLDSWTFNLFNELEEAVAQDRSLQIRVLWDRTGTNNTFLYHVQADQDPYALANYTDGVTRHPQGEKDMGAAATLRNFILEARQAFPANQYRSLLSIVDHGGGWSPHLLPPQRKVRYFAGASGFSWDWNQDSYSYFSTKDMADVFNLPTLQNQPLDIVFYDACLMAMVEEAYQLRNGVRFLLASQYETWTSWPYAAYLSGSKTRTTEAQVSWMIEKYQQSLVEEYKLPHTMSAIDLQYTNVLTETINNLRIALMQNLPAHKVEILAAFTETQKLDYDYDLTLRSAEGYVDLGDFAKKLQQALPNSEVQRAAQDVLDVLHGHRGPYIYDERHGSGDVSAYPGVNQEAALVNLEQVTGISIYLPLGEPDKELPFYRDDLIAFTQATFWDDFIWKFKEILPPQVGSDYTGGRDRKPQPLSPSQTTRSYTIYLPTVFTRK